MMRFFTLLLFTAFLISCQEDRPESLLTPDNLESQFFTIRADRDTVLMGRGGVVLEIKANTLTQTDEKGNVTIELKEALTKKDMIKGGLFTQTADGQILESGGMVYLDVEPVQEIGGDGIKVKVPAAGIEEQMQLFTLEDENDPKSGWKVAGEVDSEPTMAQIAEGKQLYRDYCSSCHDQDLSKDLTGPALGNVHLFRSKEWFVDFTKASQQMIFSRDSLAVCAWNKWKPVQMQDFEGILSDTEISNIFYFIQNESLMQKLDPIRAAATFICTQQDFVLVTLQESLRNGLNINAGLYRQTFFRGKGWINFDYFLRENQEGITAVEPLEVELKDGKDIYFEVLVVFLERDLILPLYPDADKYVGNAFKEKMMLPMGEDILFVAMTKEDGYWFGTKIVEIGQNNHHQLELHRSSEEEIFEFLERL